PHEVGDALETEVHHRVDLAARHRFSLRSSLNFDDGSVCGPDEIQVHPRNAVLGVAEVERKLAFHVADADRRHLIAKRRATDAAGPRALGEREPHRKPAASYRRSPSAAVRLEHVTVDRNRALPEPIEVEGGAKRAPDQPLDLA